MRRAWSSWRRFTNGFGYADGLAGSAPFTFETMTPGGAELLSGDQVAAASGLTGPLVSALIPLAPTVDASGPYHSAAKVYDETGLWRAKVAKLLLDSGIRHHYVQVAVREPLTVAQLQATIEEFRPTVGAPASRGMLARILHRRA